ncbi:MAG: hypothetical protein NTZ13_03135 [Candidatus Parcubacteria bacterium]|nr:hypothetical protein [Candidatus Parcubacteria bacterium]
MLLVIVVVIVTTVVSGVINGFVLLTLWGWLIVPVFHLAPITLVPAIGICLIVSYLTHQYIPDNSDKSFRDLIIESFARPLGEATAVLLIGFVLHLLM